MRPGRALPLRTILATTIVGCLVLLYLLWWTTYAGTRLEQRFTVTAPGEPGRSEGTSVRLESLTAAPLLADQEYGGEPDPAPPGAVWVVAVLEAVADPGSRFSCRLELIGADGQRWEATTKATRTLPYCSPDEIAVGRPVRFEMVFLLPERLVGQVAGVAVLDPSGGGGRDEVIRPPA
jgi:hypothetical protein